MSQKLYVGAVAKIKTTVVVDDVAVDPTSISLIVKDPAGNRTTYTPTRLDTGIYVANVKCTMSGWWFYAWSSPGPIAEGADEERFYVEEQSV
jgi:hypothetical protein